MFLGIALGAQMPLFLGRQTRHDLGGCLGSYAEITLFYIQ